MGFGKALEIALWDTLWLLEPDHISYFNLYFSSVIILEILQGFSLLVIFIQC